MFTALDEARKGTAEAELRELRSKYRVIHIHARHQSEALLQANKLLQETRAELARARLAAVNLFVEVRAFTEAKEAFAKEAPDTEVNLSRWYHELLNLRQETAQLRIQAGKEKRQVLDLRREDDKNKATIERLRQERATNTELRRKDDEIARLTAELEGLRAYREAMDATKPLKGGTSRAGFTHLEID
jgi:chromosome segregation ATPase